MIKRGKIGKKAAIEMSMGTIITIILSVSFLILGLVLLRNIFGVATNSVSTMDEKLKSQINQIFTDETKNFVIYLGQDKIAKVRAGTSSFGILAAASSINNQPVNYSQIKYRISLVDEGGAKSCTKILGPAATKALFLQKTDTWLDSSGTDSTLTWRSITLNIPANTVICTQIIRVEANQYTNPEIPDGEPIGSDSFTLEILKKGLF